MLPGKTIIISLSLAFFFIYCKEASAQQLDTTFVEKFSFHTQTTLVGQYKPSFRASYSGPNSLSPLEENQISLTATWYAGARLWKNASVFINPEVSGGSGLSDAFGVASSTNGETFRVGTHDPKLYLARLFIRQLFPLKQTSTYLSMDFNQLAGSIPTHYVAITVGKVDVSDFFDNNTYSHNPRTQFIAWGFKDHGAWDYPANTRGYTPSIILEYVTPKNELRYGLSLVPLEANGNDINWRIRQAGSHTLEYTQRYTIKGMSGAIRLLGYFTSANMGDYNQSIALNPQAPDITDTRAYGNTKYGFGINAEQAICKTLGAFFRASWDDGHHETWAFTEIDRSISGGVSLSGNLWKRPADHFGLAYVASGLSRPHRSYLQAGGKGFMLGDGNLNYGWEHVAELYYAAEMIKNSIYLSGTYQFLVNPGYNRDRGPVNVFSVRVHARI
ncbi:MAG: carbohydrate porin [Sphingobacteriaceae bacterium]